MTVRVLDRLGQRLADQSILDGLGDLGLSLVQKNITEGAWKENAPLTQDVKGNNIPLRDKGLLLSSFSHRREASSVVIGTSYRPARILHDGGVIRPRSAKYLTIPAGAKTRALMRRYGATPRACIEGMKAAGWRVWPYFGKGNPVICASIRDQTPICVFILKRSVTVPARPFTHLPPEYRAVLSDYIRRRLGS